MNKYSKNSYSKNNNLKVNSCNVQKKSTKQTEENEHGEGNITLTRMLLGLPLMFFALWVTVGHLGAISIIPEWLMNPWTMFSFATTSLLLYGKDYIKPVFHALKNKKLSLSLFLALSVAIAYTYSLTMLIVFYVNPSYFTDGVKGLFEISMFEAVIEITWIVYIGYYIAYIVDKKSHKDLDSIVNLTVKKAIVLKDGNEIEADTKDLKVGDIVIVKNGMRFPVDGKIVKGITTVDESAFTGEAIPVNKIIDSLVYGSSVSQGQTVYVEVMSTFENSAISQIIASLQKTREEKSEPASISEKLSKFVLPFILIASLSGLLIWGPIQGWNKGIEVLITTLIVACPMAFILLPPTSSLIASSVAAKRGIIFNKPNVFERYKNITTILFDKTKTLTDGEIKVINSSIPSDLESLVYSMEKVSTHPIASAITDYYSSIKPLDIDSTEEAGFGVRAEVNNKTYYFGSLLYIKNNTYSDIEDSEEVIKAKMFGSTFSYLSDGEKLIGTIELKDQIKKSAKKTVNELKKRNIKTYIVSGDNEHSVKFVANELGIDVNNVFWDQTPDSKKEVVQKLKDSGEQVLFMGDGINDAIALETAQIGVSVANGSDLAIDSSDVTLIKNNLGLLLTAMDISKGTIDVIKYGNIIASIWIVFIVSVSIAGLLIPALGAVAMVFNDTLPILISMLLFRFNKKDK